MHTLLSAPRVNLTSCSKVVRSPPCTGRACRGPHGADATVAFFSAAETECHPATKLGTGHEAPCRGEDSSPDCPGSICAQPENLAASLETMHAGNRQARPSSVSTARSARPKASGELECDNLVRRASGAQSDASSVGSPICVKHRSTVT